MNSLRERLQIAMKGPPSVKPAELARACGIKQPSVSNWLSGRTKHLEGANLLAAARFLGVTPEWLATGKGPMRAVNAQKTLSLDQADNKKPPLSPCEQVILDLVACLPKSEREELIRTLKAKKQHYEKLLEELLIVRKKSA